MFKARGTRIIFDGHAGQPAPGPLVFTSAHGVKPGDTVTIDRIPHVVTQPLPASEDVSRLTPLAPLDEVGSATGEIAAVQEQPDADADELADMLGMRMPALPPDFRDQLLRAQAGDLAAIQLMRAIGDQVPQHLQIGFMEMVHDILADAEAH